MYLTMEEINEKYNGQWVFLINCTIGEYGQTIGGEVALSTKSKSKIISEFSKYYSDGETLLTYIGDSKENMIMDMH